jgi:hypothetical protein
MIRPKNFHTTACNDCNDCKIQAKVSAIYNFHNRPPQTLDSYAFSLPILISSPSVTGGVAAAYKSPPSLSPS